MADNFKIGSLSDLVDQKGQKSATKSKKIKSPLKNGKINVKLAKKSSPMKNKPKVMKAKKLKKMKMAMIEKMAEDNEPNNMENDEQNDENEIQEEEQSSSFQNEMNNTNDDGHQDEMGKQMRTLFIGNLPANFPMKNLKKILQQYGKVISIRIRCVAPAKITLSKKAAYLSNQVNPNKKTVNAYVVFRQPESVEKALELNGTKFEENIIQVDSLTNNKQYDHTKSLFLGNLSFKTTENELREFFNDCGEIQSIRIVRDSKTGIGKGFGYVNFKSNDSVVLAMEKNGQLFKNREIRIKQYEYTANGGAAKNDTNKQSNKKRSAKVKTLKKSPKVAHQGEHGVKKAKAKKLMRKSLKNRINVAKKKIQKEKISKLIQ